MIRIELESERRRLPAILAAIGLTAILVALYGLDRQVGLLNILRIKPSASMTRPIQEPMPRDQVAQARQGEEPLPSMASADAPDRAPVVANTGAGPAPVSRSTGTVKWWQTAQRLSHQLPVAVEIRRQGCQASGAIEMAGWANDDEHMALQRSVAAMRDQGLQTYLTLWRDPAMASASAFIVRGFVGTDAPPPPPMQASMDVDALLQLAQGHARDAGLGHVTGLRPTHEAWPAGGTRVEQAITAIGDRRQINSFGTALAGESQARLTRFVVESSEDGRAQVTASLDVLLGKEPGR